MLQEVKGESTFENSQFYDLLETLKETKNRACVCLKYIEEVVDNPESSLEWLSYYGSHLKEYEAGILNIY